MRLPSGPLAFVTTVALLFSIACNDDNGGPTDPIDPGPVEPTVEVVATGLLAPQGIELDEQGRLWIAEQGTGADDGRISVLTPDGQVHPVLEGLPGSHDDELSARRGQRGQHLDVVAIQRPLLPGMPMPGR